MPFSKIPHVRQQYIQGPEATKLHTVDVWLPGSTIEPSTNKRWVIFVHGGAWRDPEIDSTSLEPALEIISAFRFQNSVAGFASINHRLSSYPDHPVYPSSPEDRSRNARHPDHLVDVSKALMFLEREYGISKGFLLVGHSAGATLAFQVPESFDGFDVPIPLGVLGVEGIYDIPELVKAYESIPVYKEIVENAFGRDRNVWQIASPAYAAMPAVWEKAKAIIIAHSDQDELVHRAQADLMMKRLNDSTSCRKRSHYFPAIGQHDEIWKEGHELARLIENVLALL